MMRLFTLLVAALAWSFAAGYTLAEDVEPTTEAAAEATEGAGEADHEGADHDGEDHGDGDHSDAAHSEESHSEGGHAEEEGVNPIAIDADLAWFTLVVFVVLATLLRAVAWDPIMKALDARESNIAGEIQAAAAKHEEAKALLVEHQAKIASATDEVRGMLEEARRDAEVTKSQIVADAQAAAAAEKQRAIREVEQARDSAIKQLAEEGAHLAIDLASKVVKQEISADRQGEIVREAIGRLASAQPSDN